VVVNTAVLLLVLLVTQTGAFAMESLNESFSPVCVSSRAAFGTVFHLLSGGFCIFPLLSRAQPVG